MYKKGNILNYWKLGLKKETQDIKKGKTFVMPPWIFMFFFFNQLNGSNGIKKHQYDLKK